MGWTKSCEDSGLTRGDTADARMGKLLERPQGVRGGVGHVTGVAEEPRFVDLCPDQGSSGVQSQALALGSLQAACGVGLGRPPGCEALYEGKGCSWWGVAGQRRAPGSCWPRGLCQLTPSAQSPSGDEEAV